MSDRPSRESDHSKRGQPKKPPSKPPGNAPRRSSRERQIEAELASANRHSSTVHVELHFSSQTVSSDPNTWSATLSVYTSDIQYLVYSGLHIESASQYPLPSLGPSTIAGRHWALRSLCGSWICAVHVHSSSELSLASFTPLQLTRDELSDITAMDSAGEVLFQWNSSEVAGRVNHVKYHHAALFLPADLRSLVSNLWPWVPPSELAYSYTKTQIAAIKNAVKSKLSRASKINRRQSRTRLKLTESNMAHLAWLIAHENPPSWVKFACPKSPTPADIWLIEKYLHHPEEALEPEDPSSLPTLDKEEKSLRLGEPPSCWSEMIKEWSQDVKTQVVYMDAL